MKKYFIICFLFLANYTYAQKPEDFGFRHFQTIYRDDTVDILIKSKFGEENVQKPLLLFCQGSLPIPLMIVYKENGKTGIYNTFVFNTDSLVQNYHLAIIGKPGIPLIINQDLLSEDLTFTDKAGNFPVTYTSNNYLEYYVKRDIAVLKFLRKKDFISKRKLVLAGHSEGATIAANIAFSFKGVTELIYSGGSPLGRIMSNLGRARNEQLTDTTQNTLNIFQYWQKTVLNSKSSDGKGDTYKGQYQYSYPPTITKLLQLKIPVFVTYGTKDFGAVSQNDYLRVAAIANKKTNFTFKDYLGLDHNFFPLLKNGRPNFEEFNWDNVGEDWRRWLFEN